MTFLETSNGWFQYYDLFEFEFLFWNCNFKSTESEFELRLISKSLVNGKIGVLNSQTMSLKYNEFWDGFWILKWAILMLYYGL